MSLASLQQQRLDGVGLSSSRIQFAVLTGFATCLLLSALLLFSVQPMFAKIVLPQLGGSPSVWAVSTCVFQALLFAGYCYAHLLNRFCEPQLAPLVHIGVLATAYLALPIGLPSTLSEPPADGAYFWLVGVLAAGVGLPFFAVSASAPLLQAWFSRTGNPHADDPYFLYGASNFGSLLALLGYPIAVEPFLGLQAQARGWSKGYLLLAAAITAAGLVTAVAIRKGRIAAKVHKAVVEMGDSPSAVRRMRWVLFAAIPSGLLVAFTTHLSTDIAAAPFLWVIPLAIFLLTFVLVFRSHPFFPHHLMLRLQPYLTAIALLTLAGSGFDVWHSSFATFAAFIVTTLVAHRELYEDRPEAQHLTAFYLWMSFGGVAGGMFAAIIAPQIFNATYEFPLLLALGMVCRSSAFAAGDSRDTRKVRFVALVAAGTIAVGLGLCHFGGDSAAWRLGMMATLLGVIAIALAGRSSKVETSIVAAMALIVVVLPSTLNRGNPSRSFFGVLRVLDTDGGVVRRFLHGTTSHGVQRLVGPSGAAILPPVPGTYYHPKSPMALAVDVSRGARPPNAVTPFRAGVIGLGIGSMACYARKDEAWRFYEIDAAVVKIAADPAKFNFLSACRPNADIVLGDARLTVAKEPSATFDYLQIDAFSSDAVPTHLLTVEAVRLYLDKLAPAGVLTLHVSNRHLDLAPVAAAAALAIPGTAVTVVRSTGKGSTVDASASTVVVVTKSPEVMAPVTRWPDATAAAKPIVAPWTDDYSDIVSALWRVYGVR